MYYKNVNELLKLKMFNDLNLKEEHLMELNEIILKYSSIDLRNYLKQIKIFIEYDVSTNISWVNRLNIIINKFRKNSSSLDSYKIRYGDEIGNIKFNEKNKLTTQNLDGYVNKYGIIDGNLKWNLKYKFNGQSLNNYILKYGENEGKIKYNDYLRKRSDTYKKNKEFGKKYDNGISLKSYINKFGNELGREKYDKRFSWYKYRYSKKYYVDKFGELKGDIEWINYRKSMCKTSLISFIKKYGVIDGELKYIESINLKKYHNSLEYFIVKHGSIQGEILWNEYRNKTIFKKSKYSKISQNLFWKIFNLLSEELKNNCYFAEYNSEFFIRKNVNIYFLDFKLGNVVIEFDGEYWHSSKCAKERDDIKNNICLEYDLRLLRINESEYISNQNETVLKCLNFILKNYE